MAASPFSTQRAKQIEGTLVSRKLSLSEWAHVAEIIGAMAIIASLLFVGYQLGENSREVRAATYQAVADNDLAAISEVVRSENLGRIFRTFQYNPEKLTESELARAMYTGLLFLRSFENTYEQYRAGILQEARWLSIRNVLQALLKTRGFTCFFLVSQNGSAFVGDFREQEIDPLLAQSPFLDRSDECPAPFQPDFRFADGDFAR
jgi:hypothetical protein